MAANEQKLKLLEGQRDLFVQRLQVIYDYSTCNLNDPVALDNFLCSVESLEDVRNNFQLYAKEYNTALLKTDKEAIPNFQNWLSFEDMYCRIKRKMSLFTPPPTKVEAKTTSSKPLIRLAPIEIPEYDGTPQNWPLFYATFNNAVHLNTSLSDTERMYYLIGKLTGKAKSICTGIVPCAENYNTIYNALISKYEDKRSLAVTYLDQMFSLKPIASATANNLESFIDQFANAYLALNNLKLPNVCDFVMTYTVLQKLDKETARLFEMENRGDEIPNLDGLISFVRDRVKVLNRTGDQSGSPAYAKPKIQNNTAAPRNNVRSFVVNNNNNNNNTTKSCSLCDQPEHDNFYSCSHFKTLSSRDRYKFIKNSNACINCLGKKHTAYACKSTNTCKHCQQKHHSMLHFFDDTTSAPPLRPAPPAPPAPPAAPAPLVSRSNDSKLSDKVVSLCSMSANANLSHERKSQNVLLGTALADVKSNDGSVRKVRFLIDNGSQNHFITKQACKQLGLRVFNDCSDKSVMGIGSSSQPILGITNLTLYSRLDRNFCLQIQPLVIKTISDELPTCSIDVSASTHLFEIPLADPRFDNPGPIEVLLGSEVFAEILRPGKLLGPPGQPDALETAFGYVVMGSTASLPSYNNDTAHNQTNRSFFTSSDESIEDLVSKFWQLESVPTQKHMSRADQECEDFYVANTHRDVPSGRYETALPFSQPSTLLGDSLTTATRRYSYLDRKFQTNKTLKSDYDQVMTDYLENDIVSPAPALNKNDGYYVIAHHGVSRPGKPLRLVCDPSMKSSTQVALNDVLHSGPNLQADLTAIILKFRLFPVALTADIKQMFLQVGIREEDRRFLNILYKFDGDDEVKLYRFNRVCFGLRCSPFLAMRTVRQLANSETDFPLASKVASHDLYMDDLGTSVRTDSEGVQLARDLIELFKRGGFDLVKFMSNSSVVVNAIPQENRVTSKIEFDKEDNLKLLGLIWSPNEDEFSIALKFNPQTKCTKRLMLSTIAKLWDINGFCAPVILYAKLLIKALWIANIDWDDQPPYDICVAWNRFLSELPALEKFKIPRFLGIVPNARVILLGFSDASEKAMGAVVYLGIQPESGPNQINLICAKSKVAPLKVVSLARLELCALLLLSQLMRFVIDTISPRCQIDDIFAFTDSTVALHWVHSAPHRFDTFVANRIAQVQEHLDPKHVFHIDGTLNPSDCISRGLSPAQLLNHTLWLHGPPWACDDLNTWPINRFTFDLSADDKLLEIKKCTNVFISTEEQPQFLCTLAKKVSSWSKLLRIVVYLYRFLGKIPRSNRMELSHLQYAENVVVKALQQQHFKHDIIALSNNRKVSKSLIPLTPFLENGLLRTGGRLEKSSLSFDAKHPLLLPKNNHIVDLLIDYYHRKYLHAGPHLLLSLLRQKFWIISGRSIVKRRFRLCNKCFKVNPRTEAPFMADLPAPRVNEAKPFSRTGVDYAGPINILISRYRGARKEKAYICLFTCLVTRAVHLELAVDLSTDSFFRAFRRFISRRSNCLELFSDNGGNFLGAKAQLDELNGFLKSKAFCNSFAEETVTQGISWHLNPPSAPHFGGIWETNVRSVKLILKRVIGDVLLTYEELLTVLTQVESLLNSRPLTAVLSSDPAEPKALCPSDFLTPGPLESFHYDARSNPTSADLVRNKRLTDQIVQRYWNRWRQEYLNTLQTRAKWNTKSNPVTKGTVVILKTENSPPLQWPLGIVEDIHPASDGTVRVVTVRTKNGTYVRPVVKLCVLPSQ